MKYNNDMENTAISIIIPIYRVKNDLANCIESLLDQDFLLPYNILLIETGSDDGSDLICQEYESKYPKKIYHFHYDKKEGISVSRNLGIHHANGQYVTFVDGDDVVPSSFLSTLYNETLIHNNVDVVTANYYRKEGNKEQLAPSYVYYGPSEKALLNFFTNPRFPFYCWNRLYRRKFLLSNHLYFSSRFGMYEDLLFIGKVFAYAKDVSFINKGTYYYIQHPNSTVHTCEDFLTPRLNAYRELKKEYHLSHPLYEKIFFKKASRKIKKQIKEDCLKSTRYKNKKEILKIAKAELKGIFSL